MARDAASGETAAKSENDATHDGADFPRIAIAANGLTNLPADRGADKAESHASRKVADEIHLGAAPGTAQANAFYLVSGQVNWAAVLLHGNFQLVAAYYFSFHVFAVGHRHGDHLVQRVGGYQKGPISSCF